MAEVDIADLTSLSSGDVDRATDVLEIQDITANQSKKITPNALMGISGAAVGTTDSQSLTNKTITAPNISDPVLSGTLTGTYTIGGTPTFPSSVVTLTGSQTLTNKVLTSPTINTATISNPTLTVDSISEFTGAAGVTIDGVLLKDSKMNGSYLTTDSVTDTVLDYPRWWQEIARTTLGVAGDTITVSSIPSRRYLMIIATIFDTGGTIGCALRFNNDSGANYAQRYSDAGGADTTAVSATSLIFRSGVVAAPQILIAEISNYQTDEKVLYTRMSGANTAGAGTAPQRVEGSAKWSNTADLINRVDLINGGSGDLAIGSEVIILGHD